MSISRTVPPVVGKQFGTRAGHTCQILAVIDPPTPTGEAFIGIVREDHGKTWSPQSYKADGRWAGHEHSYDLIEEIAPESHRETIREESDRLKAEGHTLSGGHPSGWAEFQFTVIEGGEWHPVVARSIKFPDGSIWDVPTGWRKGVSPQAAARDRAAASPTVAETIMAKAFDAFQDHAEKVTEALNTIIAQAVIGNRRPGGITMAAVPPYQPQGLAAGSIRLNPGDRLTRYPQDGEEDNALRQIRNGLALPNPCITVERHRLRALARMLARSGYAV